MIKKLLSLCLVAVMILTAFPITFQANDTPASFISEDTTGLFAHGVKEANADAWQLWQHQRIEIKADRDEDCYLEDVNPDTKYFFIPSNIKDNTVEIYNGYNSPVTVNSVSISAKSTASVTFEPDVEYSVKAEDKNYTLVFKKSTAEATLYINNPDADGNNTELYKYLSKSKDNSAKATSAIVDSEGNIDTTEVKKIKGRGNTTWGKVKKPFNVTYNDNVTIAGMSKGKKFSLLANYQDASLLRNRFLYDLADAVGVPYASDSRFVDLFMNGVYYGTYQLCQKIEVGKNDVVNDIDDEAYLTEDDNIAEDFPFLMEIDPSASGEDYTTYAGSNPITIKAPELSKGDKGYDEVKNYVANKFQTFYDTLTKDATLEDLEKVMNVESFTKLYLINELGKNWDAGVSSLFMVYKQDTDGIWKFFASPVWDYDNSLGNANGVSSELKSMGVTDYTSPTGWWCKFKGKRKNSKGDSSNIINRVACNTAIQKYSAEVWFNDFMPAINFFKSEVDGTDVYSRQTYYNLLKGTADCNYTRGWLLNTGSWIADHSSLKTATYNFDTKVYTASTVATTYTSDFKGEFDYTCDWLLSRAAWLSNVLRANFVDGNYAVGDTNGDGKLNINDATLMQLALIGYSLTHNQLAASDIKNDSVFNISDVTYLQKKLANII